MKEYLLETRKVNGKRYLTKVIEDTETNKIFVNHSGYWAFSFLCKDPPRFIVKDPRTNKWIKRPVIAIKKIRSNNCIYSKDLKMTIPYHSPMTKQMMVCEKREHQLFNYLDHIINTENLPLIITSNGMSGAYQTIPGDIHISKHYIIKNGNKIANRRQAEKGEEQTLDLKVVIEYLSKIRSSVRLDQKNILQDRDKVKSFNDKIKYLIAYNKNINEEEQVYGFTNINKANKRLLKDKTCISLSKLSKYEIPNIEVFLRSI